MGLARTLTTSSNGCYALKVELNFLSISFFPIVRRQRSLLALVDCLLHLAWSSRSSMADGSSKCCWLRDLDH